MKFSLKFLLVVVAIVACVSAYWLATLRYQKQLAEHRESFMEIREQIKAMDPTIEEKILGDPEIFAQLKQVDPVNPSIALGRGINGSSMSVGEQIYFERQYRFDWQAADGHRVPGIQFTVRSDLDQESLEPHQIIVTYYEDERNEAFAKWYRDFVKERTKLEPILRSR